MTPAEQQQLLELFAAHQYLLLAYGALALVIGGLVRLCKSDSPLPFLRKVPAAWRPRIAVALGIVGGVLGSLESKTPLPVALFGGIVAAFSAISGHEILVEGIFGGAEPFGPSTPPSSSSRESRRPSPMHPRIALLLGPFVLVLLVGCGAVAAVGPTAGVLVVCVAQVAAAKPAPTSFLGYVAQILVTCGGDMIDVLAAILKSGDPAVAAYQNDARSALADPARLAQLRDDVRGYTAAHTKGARP